jgi:hypothetical protein
MRSNQSQSTNILGAVDRILKDYSYVAQGRLGPFGGDDYCSFTHSRILFDVARSACDPANKILKLQLDLHLLLSLQRLLKDQIMSCIISVIPLSPGR